MSKKTRYSLQKVLNRSHSEPSYTLLTVHRKRFKFLPVTIWAVIYLSAFLVLMSLPSTPGKALAMTAILVVLVALNLFFCEIRMDEEFFQSYEFVTHLKLDPRLSKRNFSDIYKEDSNWKKDATKIAEAKAALDEMTRDRPDLKKAFDERFEAFSKRTSEILDCLDQRDDIQRFSTVVSSLKN